MFRLSGCMIVCLFLGAGAVRAAEPSGRPRLAIGGVGPVRLGETVSIEAIAFSPDGKYFVIGVGATPRLFETATLREPVQFITGPHAIADLAFAADGKTFAVSTVQGGTTFRSLTDGAAILGPTRFSLGRGIGDGQLAANLQTSVAWNTDEIVVRDTRPNREPFRFRLELNLHPASVSPNGRVLLTRSVRGNPLVLVDLDKGRVTHSLPTDDGLRGGTFAPNSRLLGTVDPGNNLHIWEAATGLERCAVRPHEGRRFWFAFSRDGRTVATAPSTLNGLIRLFDTLTGKHLGDLAGNGDAVRSLTFSPDDRLLASGGADSTVLLWDVADWTIAWRRQRRPLERPVDVWDDLGSTDAGKVREALAALEASGDPVCAFLLERVPPAGQPRPPAERVARWIADLDSEEFAVRQQATRELEKHGHAFLPVLRRALAETPSLEARRRLQELVDQVIEEPLTPEKLQTVRSVEVLERLNTTEARHVLKRWAEGDPEERLTREAKTALEWLARRPIS